MAVIYSVGHTIMTGFSSLIESKIKTTLHSGNPKGWLQATIAKIIFGVAMLQRLTHGWFHIDYRKEYLLPPLLLQIEFNCKVKTRETSSVDGISHTTLLFMQIAQTLPLIHSSSCSKKTHRVKSASSEP